MNVLNNQMNKTRMKRRAVVTGVAGFIGSCLVRKTLENNYEVTVYDGLSDACGKKTFQKTQRSS